MKAELLSVGSEMLRSGRRDTNSEWLTAQLNRIGIEVAARTILEDDIESIAAATRAACERSAVVLLTGGLGPTEDDRTREALSRAFGLPLEQDQAQLERLRQRHAAAGRSWSDRQARQAQRPKGAEWIDNPLGTASGLLLQQGSSLLAALPGVPAELVAMFDSGLRSRLAALPDRRGLALRILRVAGVTESSVDSRIADLYQTPEVDITILAGVEGVELHLRASAFDEHQARRRIEELERRVRERLGVDLFGADEETLPAIVGALLRRRCQTLGTAESCTSGLLAAAITDTPGSSAWYRGGMIVYSNELKITLAGVDPGTLAREGAVSVEVALELARGAQSRCGADLGVGVTGVAGPSGGTRAKPVGLVFVALADPRETYGFRLQLTGDRRSVRLRAVTAALDRLRRHLLARDESR